jgi:hypothetical protein
VDKIDSMLQRQIVKAVDNRIDIEDPGDKKYAITYFHSITWMWVSVIVTIYRIVPVQRFQTSHCIVMISKLLRSSI